MTTIPEDTAKAIAEYLRRTAEGVGPMNPMSLRHHWINLLDPRPVPLREAVALTLATHHNDWKWAEYSAAVIAVIRERVEQPRIESGATRSAEYVKGYSAARIHVLAMLDES